MPFFAVLIAGLVGSLAKAVPELVARVAVAIGIGTVVYTGFTFLLNQAKDAAFNHLGQIGGLSAQVIGILNIDVALSIIFSAYAIRVTYKMGAGALKQIVVK